MEKDDSMNTIEQLDPEDLGDTASQRHRSLKCHNDTLRAKARGAAIKRNEKHNKHMRWHSK